MKAKCHVVISGLVQGVSFRSFVKTNADELGLKGWVRNMEDRRVEAVFEGDREAIERMLELCRRGPLGARVTGLKQEWGEAKHEFGNFNIVQ